MENIDFVLPGPTRFERPPAAKNQARGRRWLLIGSVVIHFALIATLSFPPPSHKTQPPPAIQAVLYIPSVAQPEPANDISALPTIPEQPLAPESTTAEAVSTEEPAGATTDVSKNTDSDKLPPQVKPDKTVTPVVQAENKATILTQAEDSPAKASKRISAAISQAIAGQQLQKQYELAEEVAHQRRAKLKSPDLKIGEYEPVEKTTGEYTINCEKGVNSSLAVVAKLFGGNVQCNRRNEFQQFIDKRQHKQNEQ